MNLVLPEMGEGVIEATVSRWLVAVGDRVERMEPIVEVETDKVTTEIVADEAGAVSAILVAEGETVSVGTVLAQIGTDSDTVEEIVPASMPATGKNGVEGQVSTTVPPYSKVKREKSYSRKTADGRVSPVVARMAAEHELDLSKVTGTGLKGRITKRDVVAFLADKQASHPRTQSAEAVSNGQLSMGDAHSPIVNRQSKNENHFVNLSPMRRAIAEHMVQSVQTSPHATTVHEVDFSAVTAHRHANKQAFAEKGVKLTFTAYITMAVAEALGQHPLVNSSWRELDGQSGIQLHQEIHIGMATAIQNGAGLVVPVIQHAADYNLLGMARIVGELAAKGRENRLTAADMQGGTFTISNHGVSGSLLGTPIINQPQAGILGVGAIKKQVVVVEDGFGNDTMGIRPMGYLSFSFDHRILDGVSADGFVSAVVKKLERWS